MRASAIFCGILATLTLGYCLVSPSHAGGLPDDLDQYITSGMKAWKIPGLSIAVVKDGKTVLVKGYGVLETGKPKKVDGDTIFAIGSASKAFTSAAIGTLVDAEKIKWGDHVVAHWPEFKMSDPWVTQEIRVSDLMANHSGLSEISEQLWYGTEYGRDELIKRLADVPITEGFRYQFQYRNLMFLAAGMLIPQVTGSSWDDYVAETFFKPLQMDRTTTRLAKVETETNVARPHVIDYQGGPLPIPYRNIENVGPAGSILSTARNMTNWVQMLLAEGTRSGQTYLKPETLAFIERSQTPVDTVGPGGQALSPPAELRSYALSWVTESYRGTRLVWHNGDIDGMAAWVGMAPDLKLGVVILSNLDGGRLRDAMFYRIVDSYTNNPLTDLNAELLEKRAQALEKRDGQEKKWLALDADPAKPTLPIADYAGKYSNQAFGTVDMVLADGRLVYNRSPVMTLDLRCEKGNTFLGKTRSNVDDLREGKVEIEFETKDGKVTGFSEGELKFQPMRP